MKMLGIKIANDFTVTQHVQQLAMSSAQTIYARGSSTEGDGVWGGGVPLLTGGWVWGGAVPSPHKFFGLFILK